MNILFIKHFFVGFMVWVLRYRECPYSGTFSIWLISPIFRNIIIYIYI